MDLKQAADEGFMRLREEKKQKTLNVSNSMEYRQRLEEASDDNRVTEMTYDEPWHWKQTFSGEIIDKQSKYTCTRRATQKYKCIEE